MIKEKVSDRINLNILQTDKFKTNFISFFFSVPLSENTASEYSLIPKVLFRGSENYPDMKSINKRLDFLYSSHMSNFVFKRGERQVIGFLGSCLCNEYAFEDTNILNEFIDVIKDLILNPKKQNSAFVSEYVESEKSNQIDFIKSLINNKNQYAVKRCHEEMCKDEAFGISENGTIGNIEKITSENLYKAFEKFISDADIEIFFVGKCDAESLTLSLREMFNFIPRNKIEPFRQNIILSAQKVNEVEEEMNILQGKLTLGFRAGTSIFDNNYPAFSLFNEVFGGSPSSKLFMNVREKLSLCYYCSSNPESHKGILTVASGIEVENKNKAQNEILFQLSEIKNGNVTDTELDCAKKSLINGYLELYDDPQSLSLWYYGRALAGLYDTPEMVCEKIRALSKDDIIKIAKGITLDTVYFLKGVKE